MRALILILGIVMVLGGATAAQAQQPVTYNPRTLQFIPSDDHNAVDPGGIPVVTGYELGIYYALLPNSVVYVFQLGKPDPGPDGFITLESQGWFDALVLETVYVARVTAVGPEGRGISEPSNPFAMSLVPPVGDPDPTPAWRLRLTFLVIIL